MVDRASAVDANGLLFLFFCVQMADVGVEGPLCRVLGPSIVPFGINTDWLPKFGDQCGVVAVVALLRNRERRLFCCYLEVPTSDFLNIRQSAE